MPIIEIDIEAESIYNMDKTGFGHDIRLKRAMFVQVK